MPIILEDEPREEEDLLFHWGNEERGRGRLKTLQGITDSKFYHYDTPLTVTHEIEALSTSGFTTIEILGSWGATYTIKALK